MRRINLVMKYNNCSYGQSCPLCGESTEASVGPAVFLERTCDAVCDACANEYAPGLHATMNVIREMERLFKPVGGMFAEIDVGKLKGKGGLLQKLLKKPATLFKQFDGFANAKEDDVMRPDEHGRVWWCSETIELMSGGPAVRVLILPETDRQEAIALLEGIIKGIKSDERSLEEWGELSHDQEVALGREPEQCGNPFDDCGDLEQEAGVGRVLAGT